MSLHRLYVEPSARSAGAGDWLLAQAERVARSAGAERLAFHASRAFAPALALYAKRGYAATAIDSRELAFVKRFAA
jgi:GNAT superfamily N-acetyltransferase